MFRLIPPLQFKLSQDKFCELIVLDCKGSGSVMSKFTVILFPHVRSIKVSEYSEGDNPV